MSSYESDEHVIWKVRRVDLAAVVAWAAVLALAAVATAGPRVLEPWCVVTSAAAVALSLAAWASRRFDRLEREAFDRGLRAGMGIGGVPIMDQHRSS